MKIIKFVLVILIYLFNSNLLASTTSPLSAVRDNFKKYKKIEGIFKQEKKISSLNVTLSSEGVFNWSDKKLLWSQLKPTKLSYLISSAEIRRKIGDSEEQVLGNSKNSEVSLISEMILCSFSGDQSCLDRSFDLVEKKIVSVNQWSLRFEAKSKIIKKVLSGLILFGDKKFINKVKLQEKSGNNTIIYFSQIKGR